MKKRKSAQKKEENPAQESNKMMDVDNNSDDEEDDGKGEDEIQEMRDETSQDNDLDDEEGAASSSFENKKNNDTSFLDTFYGLASSDPRERAEASNAMLYYCLMGPDANTKDALYALKRLLNGLCSGRAAVRQGNASALTSFLKIAFRMGKIKEMQSASEEQGVESSGSLLDYVRKRLLIATDASQAQGRGKKKALEERDYHFGRLFGILGVIRSGVLLPSLVEDDKVSNNSVYDFEDIIQVTSGFVSDIHELYSTLNFMKEPAANAIENLLNSLYSVCSSPGIGDDACKIVDHLVQNVIIPKFLFVDQPKKKSSVFENYSAEQIAIATNIQAHSSCHRYSNGVLPAPLDKAMFSIETIPLIAHALAETCYNVTHPRRTHLVWDTLWMFLTEEIKDKEEPTKSSPIMLRRSCPQKCPVGDSNVHDILDGIIREVVIGRLAKNPENDNEGVNANKQQHQPTTHEQLALALCIVRNLLGVEFISSITGRTRLLIEVETLENVILTPVVIERLFLNVICPAGSGNKKRKSTEHILKPLALQILETIGESMDVHDGSKESLSAIINKRLVFAKCFVRCEPRFDSRSKTTTISDLLGIHTVTNDNDRVISQDHWKMWNEYILFIEQQIAANSRRSNFQQSSSNPVVNAYIDLLFGTAKTMLRIEHQIDDAEAKFEFDTFRTNTIRRILGFFMGTAFFKFTSVPVQSDSMKKKKKETSIKNQHPVVEAVIQFNKFNNKEEQVEILPYDVREVFSARFFSLLTEYIHFMLHSRVNNKPNAAADDKLSTSISNETKKGCKDLLMLDILIFLCDGWEGLEASGAERFLPFGGNESTNEKKHSDDTETSNLKAIVNKLQVAAKKNADTSPGESLDDAKRFARHRCATGCAVMASTLYLRLLNCGNRDKDDDMADEEYEEAIANTTDHEEDMEEIACTIVELEDVSRRFMEFGSSTKGDKQAKEGEDENENPLADAAELCVGILSSPGLSAELSGKAHASTGSTTKLLREAVRSCWMGCLAFSANLASSPSSSDKSPPVLLDSDVVRSLLTAIGASDEEMLDADDNEDNDDVNESDAEEEEGDDNDDDSDGEPEKTVSQKKEDGSMEDESDSEVEIDPGKLQSLLEEDSDDDNIEGQLEHHAGADAALAKFLKMKQEARKAGQQALERLEATKRLRCILLLEMLLGKSENLATLFRSDVIIKLVLPIMSYRWELEKSILQHKGGGGSTGSEKQDLLNRLNSLLITKIFKMKLSHFACSESVDIIDCAKTVASQLIIMSKKKGMTKECQSCCSNGLIMAVRSAPDAEGMFEIATTVYSGAVKEWSSQRSRINAALFSDLILHCPSIARATLIEPLSSAAKDARSPFLKAESFRLLSMLCNPKLNSQTSEVDEAAWKKLQDNVPLLMELIITGLKDKDMQKAKRLLEVLHCLEKFLLLASKLSIPSDKLSEIERVLPGINIDSPRVKNLREKLMVEIKEQVAGLEGGQKQNKSDKVEHQEQFPTKKGAGSKQSKKKKKKKSRR